MPLMEEVARLREEAFRQAGGGTGRDLDLDDHDLAIGGYNQLIAWDINQQKIVGGYRYMLCKEWQLEHISTLRYFSPSRRFLRDYLPFSMEVGRSFTTDRGTRSLFTMSALWQGLAKVVERLGCVRYLFGKVTVYPNYNHEAHRLLLLFLRKFHASDEALLSAVEPMAKIEGSDPFTGESYRENFEILVAELRRHGEHIPPMMQAYMRLCRQMKGFDTMCNRDFGNTFETAILLPVDGIGDDARGRYF